MAKGSGGFVSRGTVAFHRDFKRQRLAAVVALAFVAGGVLGLLVLVGLDLNLWVKWVLDAVLLSGVAFFGALLLQLLLARAKASECLVIDSGRIRSSLPASVDELKRSDVQEVRVRTRRGFRELSFECAGTPAAAVVGLSLARRLAVRYSRKTGRGLVTLTETQILESVDQVAAAVAGQWPEVPIVWR